MTPHHYHDPYRPNDNGHERQPNEHNRLGLELKLSEYISHTYDIIDMLVIGVHQLGNCCHPIKHGNEMVLKFPKIKISYCNDNSRTYLNTSMGTKIKIEFCWMTYSNIDSCTSRNISTSSYFIITISTEKSKYEIFGGLSTL